MLLDLTFTLNPTLAKSSTQIPVFLIIADFDIRPQYVKQSKRKIYQYSKVNWDAIAQNLIDTSDKVTSNETLTID